MPALDANLVAVVVVTAVVVGVAIIVCKIVIVALSVVVVVLLPILYCVFGSVCRLCTLEHADLF